MNKNGFQCKAVLSLSLMLVAMGCAHTAEEKKIDQELKQAPVVSSGKELNEKAHLMISADPNLTEEQKKQLRELNDSSSAMMSAYREDSLKLRELLLDKVAAPHYNPKEIASIKSKMQALDAKRIKDLFGSIEKANKILGRDDSSRKRVLRQMWDMHIRD